MPPRGVTSAKRARQYEHIKESELDRGVGEDRAEEIAARTVNKQRAQAGETKSSRGRSSPTTKRASSSRKAAGGRKAAAGRKGGRASSASSKGRKSAGRKGAARSTKRGSSR